MVAFCSIIITVLEYKSIQISGIILACLTFCIAGLYLSVSVAWYSQTINTSVVTPFPCSVGWLGVVYIPVQYKLAEQAAST